MKHVFLTRRIPDAGIKLLHKARIATDIFPHDHPIERKELLKALRAKPYDGIITLLTDNIDEEVLRAAGPQLAIVANYAVGFDNISLKAAKEHRVAVANTPGDDIAESVAEHAIALMFALAHRIVEADTFARSGTYSGWSPSLLLGNDLFGKTVGIVGMGRIGHAIARRLAEGFGMRILYTNKHGDTQAEHEFGAKRVSLAMLLRQSDIVSLHLPLTPNTRHLINASAFQKMKRSAFLINTARGSIVEESALIHALETHRIAGAALDVFEHEPAIPKTMRKLSNIVLTPHTASATVSVRNAMAVRTAQNIIAALNHKPIPYRVI